MMVLFRLITSGALPVAFAALFYGAEKREAWRRLSYWSRQLIIGVCFGGLAVLSTEFGIPVDGAVVNVRNAAPVAAGLIFGWPAGVLAGLIGGVERWFATLWGVGEFTRVACTRATILAGLFAAAVRVWMLDDKKPGWFHGLAVGVTSEVLHMLMIFLTNTDDIQRAFEVVQICAIPMIVSNGLSVMLAVWVINRIGGRPAKSKNGSEKISHTFQRWLLICVMAAFTATMAFTVRFHTQLAQADTDSMLRQSIADVQQDILDASDTALIRLTRQIAWQMPPQPEPAALERMADAYRVTEINLVNVQGIITASTHAPFVGYDMASGAQSAAFLPLLNGEESYVQPYQPIAADESIYRKYAAVATAYGFLQVGYDAERFQSEINEQILDAARNRHIGQEGFLLICNDQGTIISDNGEHTGESIRSLGHDETRSYPLNQTFDAVIHGEASRCMYDKAEGYYILAVLPVREAVFMRDVAAYILAFMETIVFAALFALIYFLIKKLIVSNIQKINHSLSLITHGNLDVTVDVRSNEEFASLSDDINTTVGALRRLIDEAAKRIDQELEFARQIQLSALPSVFPPYPGRDEFELFASMQAAKEVGGDFYDFYFIDDNTLTFAVADVSGKGIPAAMFMMRAKTLLKSCAESGMSLSEAFTQTNQQLFENNQTCMFVTAWMASVDLSTGRAVIANAGHNPPILCSRQNGCAYYKTKAGLMLAASMRMQYQQTELQLQPGDVLFLYTDGVTEATNTQNELYGEKRLLALLDSLGDLPVQEICQRVRADVDAFTQGAPQFDDITMLAFRYRGGDGYEGNHAGSDG